MVLGFGVQGCSLVVLVFRVFDLGGVLGLYTFFFFFFFFFLRGEVLVVKGIGFRV